ncbi:MAG: DKNYY domain-containing protein [Paracoccaceae bacterium]
MKFITANALVLFASVFGCEHGYSVDDGEVIWKYWDASRQYEQVVEEADAATFEILGRKEPFFRYGHDNSHVFLEGRKIEFAKSKSFKLERYEYRGSRFIYATDDESVFYGYQRIDAADVKTFLVLGEFWAQDDAHIFSLANIVPVCDRATFEVLDADHAFDASCIYYGSKIGHRIGSDPIELHGPNFLTAGEVVFYGGNPLPGVDGRTFEADSISSGKDKDGCFRVHPLLEIIRYVCLDW